jgi:hypothetical protein
VLGIDPVGRLGIGVEIVLGTPVARRHLGDGVDAVLDVGPEGLGIVGFRKEAAETDDRQRDGPGAVAAVFFVVFFQLRYSLILAISRGASNSESEGSSIP